jgi:hypothetical protein
MPSSPSVSPETKNCTRSLPPVICAPYCLRLPCPSTDSESVFRMLPLDSESTTQPPSTLASVQMRDVVWPADFPHSEYRFGKSRVLLTSPCSP